ncbi:2-oxoadipate dioxygenase/decarboxylase family protein [Pigmentibacter ruber]
MNLLEIVRSRINTFLWEKFKNKHEDAERIYNALSLVSNKKITIDHYALIDIPGPNTGMDNLFQVYSCLGYLPQGRERLVEKQNRFMWLAENTALGKLAFDAPPQVVISDFVLSEFPDEIRKIVLKYSELTPKLNIELFQKLCGKTFLGDETAAQELAKITCDYLNKDWPLLTLKEYNTVNEFNELLSWALVFGRVPNHYTFNISLLNTFDSLQNFVQWFQNNLCFELNTLPTIIKGSKNEMLEQCSTKGKLQKIQLIDGEVIVPSAFIEFTWRYPLVQNPEKWEEYFTGFVSGNANHVIESVYL